MEIENIRPSDIERRSMEIIENEIGGAAARFTEEELIILKRVIHATADFDYVKNLKFSDGAVKRGLDALKSGAVIVTDTNMALSGINKRALSALGCEAVCFMADADVAETARVNGTTRAAAAMDKAAELFCGETAIFAIGNAPTALIRLYELIREGKIAPALVIGAPVGFVNVTLSKDLIKNSGAPYIAADGRKGGSSAAAAVCNALMYQIDGHNARRGI